MTPEQINEVAMRSGLRSAMMLAIHGTPEALCDYEIKELQLIHKFAAAIEAQTREECAKVCDERANGENDAQWCADSIRSLT